MSYRQAQILGVALIALAALCALPAAATAVEPPAPLWQAPEDGIPGEGAGRLRSPQSIATDPTTGHVYVVDSKTNRVDEFTSWGGFVKSFGWGVADGTSKALQTCTTTCFEGLPGSGPGQLDGVSTAGLAGIAVGPGGDVYVFERRGSGEGNSRLQKFDPTAGLTKGKPNSSGWRGATSTRRKPKKSARPKPSATSARPPRAMSVKAGRRVRAEASSTPNIFQAR